MESQAFLNDRVRLFAGDCRDALRELPDASIDSVVTDPPYALVSIVKRFGGEKAAPAAHGKDGLYARASAGFMGKQWDTGETAFAVEFWAEVLRVLKPGGHVAAFSGTRTYHRLAVAIEDAGFEIRDQLAWVYGTGFPKSHDVSKGIDKAAGATRDIIGRRNNGIASGTGEFTSGNERSAGFKAEFDVTAPATPEAAAWHGWGTALKPAWEPIVLARRPLIGTVAANVLEHGTGAINIDGCRVDGAPAARVNHSEGVGGYRLHKRENVAMPSDKGRWPANIIHDGSGEVLAAFPYTRSGQLLPHHKMGGKGQIGTFEIRDRTGEDHPSFGDSGSASRFFYSAKASKKDRANSKHPTVKPVALMQWLCRLITPPGGTLLDPFAGSGTTGEAAYLEGFNAILCEREEEYQADIASRMAGISANDNGPLFAAAA